MRVLAAHTPRGSRARSLYPLRSQPLHHAEKHTNALQDILLFNEKSIVIFTKFSTSVARHLKHHIKTNIKDRLSHIPPMRRRQFR